MINKAIIRTLSILGIVAFIVSELLYTQLPLINVTIALIAFIFLPIIIDQTFKLRLHFSVIYLGYLGLFLLSVLFSKVGILDTYTWSTLIRLLVVFSFFGLYIFRTMSEKSSRFPSTKDIIAGAVVVFISVAVTFIGVRDINSLVSLDIPQHQAVVNQAFANEQVCVLPSQCNNLFLKDGYTTLYHSVLFFVSPLNTETSVVLYTLDIAWVIVAAIAVLMFARKYFENPVLASVATIVAMHTFINYAYPFSFFIPQALTFIIFMLGYKKTSLNTVQLISFIAILITTHFVIGTFLSVLLVLIYAKKHLRIPQGSVTFTLSLGVIFTILLSAVKLSFETLIQGEEVKFLGGTTNPAFPENIVDLMNINPLLLVLFILAVAYYLKTKKFESHFSDLIDLSLISLSIYFIAPTYSKKFLIGVGIWMAIVVVKLIMEFLATKYSRLLGVYIILAVFSLFSFTNAYISYQEYFDSSNVVSVLKSKDAGLIKYLNDANINCTLISDPITQILATGLTKQETFQGQYMVPEMRQLIHTFLQEPTQTRLNKVLEYPEENEVCFIYSYRLEETRTERVDMWANQLYYYVTDSEYTLSSTIEPIQTLNDEMTLVYKDKYYYVFK